MLSLFETGYKFPHNREGFTGRFGMGNMAGAGHNEFPHIAEPLDQGR